MFIALPIRVKRKSKKPVAGENPSLAKAATIPPVYKKTRIGNSKNTPHKKELNKGGCTSMGR